MNVITKDVGTITLTERQIDLIRQALEILQGNLERAGGSFAKRVDEIKPLITLFS